MGKSNVGNGILDQIGDIKKFKKLRDGWVRWELIQRDFNPKEEFLSWEKGVAHCATIKARLGTVLEHRMLYEAFKANPKIKKDFFPNARDAWYWTEEDVSGYDSSAWCVYFTNGIVGSGNEVGIDYVRPVRASQ